MVRSSTAEIIDIEELATNAVAAPNWFQRSPKSNDAGKTVIP